MPADPPAIGAVRLSIRPNNVSSDDRSFSDDANIIAVCALLPPMGMLLLDVGEYVSMLISESNASLRSVVNLLKIGNDSLFYI